MSNETILLVDDEQKELNWLKQFCATHASGLVIETATSLDEALEKIARGFLGMITDGVMGGNDIVGVTLISHARDTLGVTGSSMALHSLSIDVMPDFVKGNLRRKTPGLWFIQKRNQTELARFLSSLGA